MTKDPDRFVRPSLPDRSSDTPEARGPEALRPAPASVLLTLLQPSALFLLDAAGIIVALGGAWEAMTGLTTRESVGQPLTRFLLGTDGLQDARGQLETANLRSWQGERRVRVVWRRENGWTAGSLEWQVSAAHMAFHQELQMQELRLAIDDLVRALGKHMSAREREHIERVAGYAERFGEALGLSAEQLRDLRWGAHLHDVGKASVPDGILLKEAPLTPEERGVVQQHPARGHAVLAELAFLPPSVRDMVLYHHERWDGSGYPRGLRGNEIPFLTRVLSVVDVFEALTSARAYKDAWDYREAAEYLLREAGRHFDPELVGVFVRDVLHLTDL